MRLIDLPKNNRYKFTMTGLLYDIKSNEFVKMLKIDDSLVFPIYDEKEKLSYVSGEKLFSSLYYGDIDLPIKYKDEDLTNLSSSNITYKIEFDKICEFSNHYVQFVILKDILFKRSLDYPEYFVSMNGVIYGSYRRNIMCQSFDKDCYRFIKLSRGNSIKEHMRTHRFVYETFASKIPDNCVIDHYDTNKNNNCITNLFMVTAEENNIKRGVYDNNPLFNREDTIKICENIMAGISIDDIASIFKLNNNEKIRFYNYCIGLSKGLYHKDILYNYDLSNLYFNSLVKRRSYSDDQIHSVCYLLEQKNLTKPEISKILGIPLSIVKILLIKIHGCILVGNMQFRNVCKRFNDYRKGILYRNI